MTRSDIRKGNLRHLVEPEVRGNVANFARRYGIDETYLRQLFNTEKRIGDKAAEKFEQQIGLRPGALDDPDNPPELRDTYAEVEAAIQRADFLSDTQKDHFLGLLKSMAR